MYDVEVVARTSFEESGVKRREEAPVGVIG